MKRSLNFSLPSVVLAIFNYSVFKTSENPTQDSILGVILSVLLSIMIFSKIKNRLERSLSNLADVIILFELISFPALMLLLSDVHVNHNPFNFMDLLYSFVFASMIALRLLSTYSGAILCWKLIKDRNQGGPYSIRSRIYQGIAVIAWLIQIFTLVLVILLPDLLFNFLLNL